MNTAALAFALGALAAPSDFVFSPPPPAPATPQPLALPGEPLRAAALFAPLVTSPPPGAMDVRKHARHIYPGGSTFRFTRFVGGEPVAIYGVRFDRAATGLRLASSPAAEGNGFPVMGRGPIPAQAMLFDPEATTVVAAINADFYKERAHLTAPVAHHVVDGELVAAPVAREPDFAEFMEGPDGTLAIGPLETEVTAKFPTLDVPIAGVNQIPPRRRQDHVILYTPLWGQALPLPRNALTIVLRGLPVVQGGSGGRFRLPLGETTRAEIERTGRFAMPEIPSDGALLVFPAAAYPALAALRPGTRVAIAARQITPMAAQMPVRHAVGGRPVLVRQGRAAPELHTVTAHPRSAVGFNAQEIIFVTVDGRRPGHSIGLSQQALAELLIELGCTAALNLDGGGSTTLVVRDEVQNRPSDGLLRPTINGLFALSDMPRGAAAYILPEAADAGRLSLLAGTEYHLTPLTLDAYLHPVAVPGERIEWSLRGNIGAVDETGHFTAAPGGDAAGEVHVRLLRPARGQPGVSGLTPVAGILPVHIYEFPPVVRLTPPMAHLEPGEEMQVQVTAEDERGFPLRGSVLDQVALTAVPAVLGVTTPYLTFAAAGQADRGCLLVRINSAVYPLPVTVGSAPRLDLDFDTAASATFASFPRRGVRGAVRAITRKPHEGRGALQLQWQFPWRRQFAYAAYARLDRPIGEATGISVWVRGNSAGQPLRAAIVDGRGKRLSFALGEPVASPHEWQERYLRLPRDLTPPLMLESLYAYRPARARTPRAGRVDFDALTVYEPPANFVGPAAFTCDPVVGAGR